MMIFLVVVINGRHVHHCKYKNVLAAGQTAAPEHELVGSVSKCLRPLKPEHQQIL